MTKNYCHIQDVLVLSAEEECNQAFRTHIINKEERVLGVDCEWNPERPVRFIFDKIY